MEYGVMIIPLLIWIHQLVSPSTEKCYTMGWQTTFTLPRKEKGCHLVTEDVLKHIGPGLKGVQVCAATGTYRTEISNDLSGRGVISLHVSNYPPIYSPFNYMILDNILLLGWLWMRTSIKASRLSSLGQNYHELITIVRCAERSDRCVKFNQILFW